MTMGTALRVFYQIKNSMSWIRFDQFSGQSCELMRYSMMRFFAKPPRHWECGKIRRSGMKSYLRDTALFDSMSEIRRLRALPNEMKPHSADYLNDSRDFWWNRDFLELMARRLSFEKVCKVLDVGCGASNARGKIGRKVCCPA
jgi:hypothetical protein